MKMQIKGLTPATVTFNALGLILRGEEEAGVEVINADQRREISELVDAGVVTVLNVETPEPIEQSAPPKRKRPGRPKGSKNKPKAIKKVAESTEESTEEKPQAPVPEDDGSDQVSVDDEGSSKVTIATPSGVITAETKHSFAGEMGESEATQASLEAMKKLEAEERGEIDPDAPPTPVKDEKDLSPNEQMGRKAFVGTGDETTEVDMVNSLVPESDLTKDAKFIDPESPGNETTDTPVTEVKPDDGVDLLAILDEPDNDTQDAFIENDNKDDDVDDAFIEI